MLSAASIAIPEAGEVAHRNAKKAVQYPVVAGTYSITISGFAEGTVVSTQKGKSVHSKIQVAGLPDFEVSARLQRKSPTTFYDRKTVVGDFTLAIHIDYAVQNNVAIGFVGQVRLDGDTLGLPIFGLKTVAAMPDAMSGRAAKAVPRHSNITANGILHQSEGKSGGQAVQKQSIPAST